MEEYGFVYIWRDVGRDRYYIGAHWVNNKREYICSSLNMKRAFKKRPQDFRRHILFKCSSRDELWDKEYEWLKLIKEEDFGKRYYNTNAFRYHGSPMQNRHHSESTKKQISENQIGKVIPPETIKKMMGRTPWNKGKTNVYSESQLENLSRGRKGKYHLTDDHKEILRQVNTGSHHPHSEESKEKIRQGHIGKIYTEERKANMRIAQTKRREREKKCQEVS